MRGSVPDRIDRLMRSEASSARVTIEVEVTGVTRLMPSQMRKATFSRRAVP